MLNVLVVFTLERSLSTGDKHYMRGGPFCPYPEAFLSDSSLPFQAPVTVCQKKSSWLISLGYVREELASKWSTGTDIKPHRIRVRREQWANRMTFR